jgi:hypothetical protein
MGNQITRSNGDYTTTRTHETTAMANTYHASTRRQKRTQKRKEKHRRVVGGKYKDRANAGGGYVYDADEHADMRRGVRLPT